ncbi:MAG: M23 family metallopeptidase, partial [Rhodothermales bacterium]|nr:M23 family metallopeptidase [Rhodothermales bacterium]
TALAAPHPIALPFREALYFDPSLPTAYGYRVELERGQQLLVRTAMPDDHARVFVDLFTAPRDSAEAPRPVRSADSTGALTYAIRRSGAYLLRLQPELLHEGRVTLTVQTDASLAFPVAGVDSRAIRSRFGAPRDGGRRRHHGVDIFAPRGTPAVAATDAVVSGLRNGGLGGKSVWLRDADGHNLYYAHLDSQLVRRGQRVSVGDTVGLVGNTGNARTTPPHLHFGIYRDGPTDPYPFIHRPTERPAALRVDSARFGQWARAARTPARVRTAPSPRSDVLAALPRQTAVYVAGGHGAFYRVTLPDGRSGYLAAALLEPADAPIAPLAIRDGRPVRRHPAATAPAIDSLAAGATAAVLARYEAFVLIDRPGQQPGWIQE